MNPVVDFYDKKAKDSIYIFDSEQHREEGLADFRKQTEKYDMLYPEFMNSEMF